MLGATDPVETYTCRQQISMACRCACRGYGCRQVIYYMREGSFPFYAPGPFRDCRILQHSKCSMPVRSSPGDSRWALIWCLLCFPGAKRSESEHSLLTYALWHTVVAFAGAISQPVMLIDKPTFIQLPGLMRHQT